MGAAIVRSLYFKYTQSIEAYRKKLLKIVNITLLQYNYELSHGNVYRRNGYRRKLS